MHDRLWPEAELSIRQNDFRFRGIIRRDGLTTS